jgi:hypothetical protein
VFSVQVIDEFVYAARRLPREWKEILEALALWEAICLVPAPLTLATHRLALQIAQPFG